MQSGSRSESRKTSVSSRATRDATSSGIGKTLKTDRKESSGGSKKQENNENKSNSEPENIPLIVARDRLGGHYKNLRNLLVLPLFSNAIIPEKKYEAMERMKLALKDVTAKLEKMDATDRNFKQVWANHEKIKEEKKNLVKEIGREPRKDTRKMATAGTSVEARDRTQQIEQNLRQSEQALLVATGKMKQRTEEWEESMNKFCEEFRKVHAAGRDAFGARGCLDEEQDKKNWDFVRFCRTVTDYVISRCENLDDIKIALGLVDNASSALKDWSEIYDWRAIQKVKQDLDDYGHRWFWGKLDGNWGDRSVTVRENIIEEAKAESEKVKEEAEKLKIQGNRKEKTSDAERRLNKAMEDMQNIYKASQKASEKKTSRWHIGRKRGTVEQAQ